MPQTQVFVIFGAFFGGGPALDSGYRSSVSKANFFLRGATTFRAEKTMTATDVTGFDAIFSTGFFATFSRF